MPKPLLILQHYWCETPGVFGEVLQERTIPTITVCGASGDIYPTDLSAYSGVLAMGGPMSVYEEEQYPWLQHEEALLKAALRADLPTVGVCLGSQLIAKAAGAVVSSGARKEIGWYPVTLSAAAVQDPLWQSFPQTFEVFEWHGDVFTLPHGASALASSAFYPYQAFRIGHHVYGVLFHLEVTAAMIQTMLTTFADEVAGVRSYIDPTSIEKDLQARAARLNGFARQFFSRFCDML